MGRTRIQDDDYNPPVKPRPHLDTVLSAIRRGVSSLPALKADTGLDYAELQLNLYQLEYEWRAITMRETGEGFARYFPTDRERTHPKPQKADPKAAWRTSMVGYYPAKPEPNNVRLGPAVETVCATPVQEVVRETEKVSARNPDTAKTKRRERRERRYDYQLEERICAYPVCGRIFFARVRKDAPSKYHSKKCQFRHFHAQRVAIPHDYDLLYDLYVTKNMTTPEIARHFGLVDHHAVTRRFRDVGIIPRKVGISRHKICIVEGCDEPCFKLKHPINGSPYGKRCEFHWRQHRKRLADDYYARTRGAKSPAPVILNALREGADNVYQIAKHTGLATKKISVTLRHMKEQGLVVHAGTFRPKRHGGGKAIIWAVAA